MTRILIVLLLTLLWVPSLNAGSTRRPYTSRDWSQLASRITKGKTTARDKAHAIYRWLCDNIAYDTDYKIYHADQALEARKGVCQAYSEMYFLLAEAAGLKVEIVTGDARGDGGHAWNYVYDDAGRGIMVDATWGAGSVGDGVFYRNFNYDGWFDVTPEWMIFSHFPASAADQHLASPITRQQFDHLPDYGSEYQLLGFDGASVLAAHLAGRKVMLPEIKRKVAGRMKIAGMPRQGELRVGEPYEFALGGVAPESVAIKNGDDWYYDWWKQDRYTVTRFVPSKEGKVTLYLKGKDSLWWTAVVYTVAKPTAQDIANLERNAPGQSPSLAGARNFDRRVYSAYGVNLASLLKYVKTNNIKVLPILWDHSAKLSLVNIPWNGQLRRGQSYTVTIRPKGGEYAVTNEKTWFTSWRKNTDGSMSLTFTPTTAGKANLWLKNSDGQYQSVIQYEVI